MQLPFLPFLLWNVVSLAILKFKSEWKVKLFPNNFLLDKVESISSRDSYHHKVSGSMSIVNFLFCNFGISIFEFLFFVGISNCLVLSFQTVILPNKVFFNILKCANNFFGNWQSLC